MKMGGKGFLMLIIGMWSVTQIGFIGFIGISELVIFLIAPFVYIRNMELYRKDGLKVLFVLLFLTMISCWISGFYNESGLIDTIKGFASIYGIFAGVAVMYPLLRSRPDTLKWFLLGVAISGVISIFIFQPGSAHAGALGDKTELTREGLQESVTGYALFWVTLISTWVNLPIQMSYLSVPAAYSVLVPMACAAYALVSTSSGRSAFLVMAFSVVLLALGGKSVKSLSKLRKNFAMIVVILGVAGLLFANLYKYTARTGMLGEDAQEKYERQVQNAGKNSGSPLTMLMAGRLEFFIGAIACFKHPILGCGPKSADREGLVGEFYQKYGTYEDVIVHERTRANNAMMGIYYEKLPAHSHIISFWLWFGLIGGILWLYILVLWIKTLKNYMSAIPQWFGYFALVLPSAAWAVFFSPFGDRLAKSVIICCCFVAKNVFDRKVFLPPPMIAEAAKHWRE